MFHMTSIFSETNKIRTAKGKANADIENQKLKTKGFCTEVVILKKLQFPSPVKWRQN